MKNSLNVHNLHKCTITAAYTCISGKISDKIRKNRLSKPVGIPRLPGLYRCVTIKKKEGIPMKIKLNPDKFVVFRGQENTAVNKKDKEKAQ